jgi:hypothetical protein
MALLSLPGQRSHTNGPALLTQELHRPPLVEMDGLIDFDQLDQYMQRSAVAEAIDMIPRVNYYCSFKARD